MTKNISTVKLKGFHRQNSTCYTYIVKHSELLSEHPFSNGVTVLSCNWLIAKSLIIFAYWVTVEFNFSKF